MVFRRRSFPIARRSTLRRRRRFEWAGVTVNSGSLNATNGFKRTDIVIPTSQITDMTEPTLKRTHGQLIVQGGISPAESVGAFAGSVAFGIQVASGATVDQWETPWTQLRSGRWLWHQIVPLFTLDNRGLAVAGAASFAQDAISAVARIVIDARAQRRIDEFDVVIFSAEAVQPSPGFTWTEVDYAYGLRMLLEQV